MRSQKLADNAEREACALLNDVDPGLVYSIPYMSTDIINHPKHYTSSSAKCSKCSHPIECIDVIEDLPFNVGAIIKYLWRREHKGSLLEDLKKCQWYINREISRIERANQK